jgi:hypothetical protein
MFVTQEIYNNIPESDRLKISEIYTLQKRIREELNLKETKPILLRSKDKKNVPVFCKNPDHQIKIDEFIDSLYSQKIMHASLSTVAIFSAKNIIEIYEKLTPTKKAQIQHIYDFQYEIRDKLKLNTNTADYL